MSKRTSVTLTFGVEEAAWEWFRSEEYDLGSESTEPRDRMAGLVEWQYRLHLERQRRYAQYRESDRKAAQRKESGT